jgi:myosin-5
VVAQLRDGGLVDAIHMARSVYPNRLSQGECMDRFRLLCKGRSVRGDTLRAQCESLLVSAYGVEGYVVSNTCVYFEKGTLESLEKRRAGVLVVAVETIQRVWRRWCGERIASAARCIQRAAAGWRHRRAFLYLRLRVVQIQTRWRILIARRLVYSLRRSLSSVRIQSVVRMYLFRRRYLSQRDALQVIYRSLVLPRKMRSELSVRAQTGRSQRSRRDQLLRLRSRESDTLWIDEMVRENDILRGEMRML